MKFLNETREEFLKEISGLSDAQLNFKSAPDRWTIAGVAEHIIVVENNLFPVISVDSLKTPAPEGEVNFRVYDRAVLMAITNRTRKLQAPESVQPNGRWKTKAELIGNFEKIHGQMISFLETTNEDLRNHFLKNPLIGMIDSYQWLIFLSGHTERHLAQIKEIKAAPNFPKK